MQRGEGLVVGEGGPGPQFALKEHLLPAGVAPHAQRGQVHRQVVPRLLDKRVGTPSLATHVSKRAASLWETEYQSLSPRNCLPPGLEQQQKKGQNDKVLLRSNPYSQSSSLESQFTVYLERLQEQYIHNTIISRGYIKWPNGQLLIDELSLYVIRDLFLDSMP